MSVCFSTRSSLRGRQRKEREKGGKMSLFSLKKHSLSLSLFLFSSFSFFLRYVLAVDSFFFPLFCTSFRWVKSKCVVFSLFSPCFCWGDRKTHPFVSLSLLRRERFGKPDLPIEYSAAHAERAIIIFEKEEIDSSDKLARESRKKKRWIGFLLIAAQEHRSHRAVASKTKTHTSENKSVRVCYLPSAPAGHASKIHSSVALIYVCVCVYSV